MNEMISLLFRAAESDAPGDDEYAAMVANCALVLMGARRGARLAQGLLHEGHLWRALAATRGHRLVTWGDPDSERFWTEPLFVKAKHAKEAEAMRGLHDSSPEGLPLMGRLLGYPEFCKSRRKMRARRAGETFTFPELYVRIQRGYGVPSRPLSIAAVAHCEGRAVARAAGVLQSWADAGNRALCGVAFGASVGGAAVGGASSGGASSGGGVRVHFSAGVGRY
jgi:hypothetical protein